MIPQSTLGHVSKQNYNSKRYIHLYVYDSQDMWKQPKHSLTDEWLNNLWYTHTQEYTAMCMQVQIIILLISEVSQKDKIPYNITYVESKNMTQDFLAGTVGEEFA